jgi:uncharacterized protein (DUF2147 family)
MKTIALISFMLFFVKPGQDNPGILGTWVMEDNNTEIEIEKDGDLYKGTVTKSDLEKAVGKEMLQDLKEADGIWKGKFYVVRRDRLVDVTLKELDDGMLEMEITGPIRSKIVNLSRAE